MDRTLLDEIEYKGDLEAGRESFVFKFADLPTVFFGNLRLPKRRQSYGVL